MDKYQGKNTLWWALEYRNISDFLIWKVWLEYIWVSWLTFYIAKPFESSQFERNFNISEKIHLLPKVFFSFLKI